jgi:hypothetical protein
MPKRINEMDDFEPIANATVVIYAKDVRNVQTTEDLCLAVIARCEQAIFSLMDLLPRTYPELPRDPDLPRKLPRKD